VKRFSAREINFLIFASIAGIIMLAGFIGMNIAVARTLGRGGDLLLPWKAARAFLFEKAEPYGGGVADAVQREVYGRNAQPGEKPYILDMPFHILMLYFPLGAFEDGSVARGIDLLVSEACLLALILLSVRLTDWQPRRLFAILLFLLSALSFYSLTALSEGSAAILLGLIYAGTLLALRAGSDELVGALMAISLYRLEIGGPFLLLIGLRVLAQRRWRVLWGLLMTLFIMLAIAFLVYPGWVVPYLRGNLANLDWEFGFSPGKILTEWWPAYGARAGWALTAVLSIALATEWATARAAEFRRFYWAACLTLAITPLLGVRAEIQNLVVLLIPLALIFATGRERWKAGYWLSGALLALVFATPWVLLLRAPFDLRLREQIIFLFLPAFTVTGLVWIRWWALRPPRTWLERATQPEYR
jgi:hypothetical protein